MWIKVDTLGILAFDPTTSVFNLLQALFSTKSLSEISLDV